MPNREMRLITIIAALMLVGSAAFPQVKAYDIIAFGAKAGLRGNNAVSIQHAIDAAALAGGGQVLVPGGIFVTGPVVLKSGVELHLDDNALLLGTPFRLDYTGDKMALVSARDQQDIAVTGNGIIDGNGRELVENVFKLLRNSVIKDSEWLLKRPTSNNRPPVFLFYGCRNVTIKDITIKNSASWVQNYTKCTGLLIDHIKVESTAYWNNDGIDVVDSKNVKILNSFVNAADDGICLKSEDVNDRCENIEVYNDTIRSSASAFKLGTGSSGGFRHIIAKNLLVYDTYRSAIALETVDGAILEDIDIRGVTAKNTGNAIFIRLGSRNKDGRYGTLKHVYIADVKAEIPDAKPDIGYPVEGPPPKVAPHNLPPSIITGIPGHPVEDVTIENVEITYGGGAKKSVAYINTDSLSLVTENIAGYPEFTMFGEIPSWGFYIRHAAGIKLKNIKLTLSAADFRPAIICDDVKNIDIQTLNLPSGIAIPAIILNKVTQPAFNDLQLPSGNANAVKEQ